MNHCCDYINLSSSSTLHPDGEKRGREKRKKKTEYKVREIEGGQGRERNRVEKIEGGREKLREREATESFRLERCHFMCNFISKSIFRVNYDVIILVGKGSSTSFHN